MKRGYAAGIFTLLVMTLVVLGAAAGCSSSAATTTTTTSTPGGAGGGLVVRSDSINSLRIESMTTRSDGVTDMAVRVLSTQNVSDLENPVADKVGQTIDVWTDEDVSGFKAGDTIDGHIALAGDAIIGITYHLYDIVRK